MALARPIQKRVNTIQGRIDSGQYGADRVAKMQNRVNRLQAGGAIAQPSSAAPAPVTGPTQGLGQNITGISNDFGSTTLETDAQGNTTQKTTMAPDQKALLDQQVGRDTRFGNIIDSQIGSVQQAYKDPLDISGIGNDPRNMDFQANRKAMEDRYMGRFNELNGSRFTDDQNSLEQQLANRGIAAGNPLYEKELQRLSRQQADERSGAMMNALNMSGTEMQRDYSLGADARDRSINETLMQRDRPYQEMANVLGQVKGPMIPQQQDVLGSSLTMRGQDMAQGQFDDTMTFNRKQNALDRKQQSYLANLNRGGGGGGGGAGPTWQQMGFSSPMEHVQWQQGQEQQAKQWEWANNPQYRQPKQQSPYAQIGGALAGSAASAAGKGIVDYIFS